MALFNWVKTHKLISLLVLVIIYLLFKDNILLFPQRPLFTTPSIDYGPYSRQELPNMGEGGVPEFSQLKTQESNDFSGNRIVIQESNISLLVEDVRKIGDQILEYVKSNGGYLVYTSYTRPTESPFASITVRVPTDKLDQALYYFRSLAVKVASENLVGTDVTEEYTDIEARLSTLQKTKAKFEEILDKATDVADILTVNREIINIQSQIDAFVGQKLAIEKNAKLTKITIYLSTDELALPYTPDKVFRPDVVFKHAVRSLLNTLRIGAEALIWLAVYSPLVAAIIVIYILYKRYRVKKIKTPSN